MINNFIKTGEIESWYLIPEESTYLTNTIDYCNLFFRKTNLLFLDKTKHNSITCIFKKKM